MNGKDLVKRIKSDTDLMGGTLAIGRLLDRFNSLFDEVWSKPLDIHLFEDLQTAASFPKINVIENENSYEVEIAAAGFDKDNVELEIKDNTLYIKGEVRKEAETNEKKFLKREISYRSFRRPVKFPVKLDVNNISCSYENGIIKCTLGKVSLKPEDTPVKVKIN